MIQCSFESDSNLDEDACDETPMSVEQLSAASQEEDNAEIDDNDGRDDETGPESGFSTEETVDSGEADTAAM